MINWRPKGASGWNQLHLSASTGDLPTLRNLIKISREDAGDSKLQLSSKRESKLDIPVQSGDRALHIALRKGQAVAARELVRAGCDVRALGSRGVRPVFFSFFKNQKIRIIGTDELLFLKQETALHIAASRGMLEELRWFINENGLDIHALSKDGSTCVHMAASEGKFFLYI